MWITFNLKKLLCLQKLTLKTIELNQTASKQKTTALSMESEAKYSDCGNFSNYSAKVKV